MKAMLSQPMAGKTDAEIIATREKAINALKEKGYEIVPISELIIRDNYTMNSEGRQIANKTADTES